MGRPTEYFKSVDDLTSENTQENYRRNSFNKSIDDVAARFCFGFGLFIAIV